MLWHKIPGLLLVVLAWPAAASALVVIDRDFRELVQRAELIVEGTVARIDEAPDAAGIQRTLVALAELTVHKGEWSESEFVLDVAGGSKNGLRAQVLELPSFRVGEQVILFVRGNGREVFPVVGVHQGYFRVVKALDGEERVVRCDGLPVVGRTQRALRFAPRAPRGESTGISLREFRSWIHEELDRLPRGDE
ncbi:MAG: hypothetical protein N3C12_01660 [Candidatus Binatia bacterium]|nr:hypothetical protein [Candidatus Binatia bacterium]